MPKLRPDAKYDIGSAVQHAVGELLTKTDYIYQGCINCNNFNQTLELCKLANQRPPAKVIVFGCPKWDFDGIPF